MATFNEEIYTILKNDATLTALVAASNIYYEAAPENKLKSVDCVVYGSNVAQSYNTTVLDNYGDEIFLYIKVTSKDSKSVYTIGSAIKALLKEVDTANIRSVVFDRDQYLWSDEDRVHILNLDFTVDYCNDETTGGLRVTNVTNSDATYDQDVTYGSDLVLPDITITKNDDTTVTYPAAKDLDIADIDPPTPLTTWAQMVAAYGIGYNYPQPTGQTTIYRTGDDAWAEANIFTPAVRAANSLKPRQSLADFLTLNNNNAFGNTNRFTDINGLQVYGDNYLIDHYTGLGWYRAQFINETWNDFIDNSLGVDFGGTQSLLGYTDWFGINLSIYRSVIDGDTDEFINELLISSTRDPWTSTTYITNTAEAFYGQDNGNIIINVSKSTSSLSRFICRKHY